VVVTVMTNLGFRLAMRDNGIAVRETQVGDRYVLEALDSDGLTLGGEQSGHIVFRELATTGDGVLTGLLLLDLMRRLDAQYPQYGFIRHVGYATRQHLEALRRFGPSPLHRRSFAPCNERPVS